MPYIAIKAFPKDAETKKKVVEKNQLDFFRGMRMPTGSSYHFT